ncbi:SEC-C metal-binding domain-containing protein, partial [Pseudomonas sp. CCI4.2]
DQKHCLNELCICGSRKKNKQCHRKID